MTMIIANAEKIKTDKDSKLNGGAVLMDESPILMAATHIETFIHLRKVRSLAKKSLGSTFLAPSLLKVDLVVVLRSRPPKIPNIARERGLGWISRGSMLSARGDLMGETPGTFIVDTNGKTSNETKELERKFRLSPTMESTDSKSSQCIFSFWFSCRLAFGLTYNISIDRLGSKFFLKISFSLQFDHVHIVSLVPNRFGYSRSPIHKVELTTGLVSAVRLWLSSKHDTVLLVNTGYSGSKSRSGVKYACVGFDESFPMPWRCCSNISVLYSILSLLSRYNSAQQCCCKCSFPWSCFVKQPNQWVRG